MVHVVARRAVCLQRAQAQMCLAKQSLASLGIASGLDTPLRGYSTLALIRTLLMDEPKANQGMAAK
jgi:hypothetical protein